MNLFGFIYSSERLGKHGKKIKIFKIRTMEHGADSDWKKVAENGIDGLGKIKSDPRITRFGRFLRRFWIDEIPQLYNLINGDISLVGIRPKIEESWGLYPREFKERALKHRPGLIGIAYSEIGLKDFSDLMRVEERYITEREKSPNLTDRRYLCAVVKNIVFEGVRSI